MSDKLITYARFVGATEFDWNKFLSREAKDIDWEEWDEALTVSAKWVTCACGNQCSLIPRNQDGSPVDQELANLGWRFTSAIDERFLRESRIIMSQIEKRSAFLLEQMGRKL